MKLSLSAILIVISLAACTRPSDHEHGLSQFKFKSDKISQPAIGSPVASTAPAAIPLEKVKYAGAVVFEGGSAKDQDIFSTTRSPIFKIIVCIPRTGETNLGEIDFNFKDLGMPNFNKNTPKDAKSVKNAWADLESFTMNYTMSGDIQNPAPGLAYGQVNFKGQAVNPKWGAEDEKQKFIQDLWVDDLKVSLTSDDLMSTSTNNYFSEGQIYYINTTLYRFTQQVDKMDLITDCENSNQQVIYQKDLDKKVSSK